MRFDRTSESRKSSIHSEAEAANIKLMSSIPVLNLRSEKRHDLRDLIALYESNFVRLDRLVPELERLDGTVVSSVAGALDLFLTVEERFKYTTTINLTYQFDDDDRYALEPNAKICVYHDVRAVEIVSDSRRRRTRKVRSWRRGRMPEIDRKWEMNRFLAKWLNFCTNQGHIFLVATSSATSPRSAQKHRF